MSDEMKIADLGEVHVDKIFLRHHIGKAKNDTHKLELSTTTTGCPMVSVHVDGVGRRAFILSWDDIIKLAINRGLLEEATDEST